MYPLNLYLCRNCSSQVKIGRAYGRVGRRLLREHLLRVCKEAGVVFLDAEVTNIEVQSDLRTTKLKTSGGLNVTSK